jgi:hypothetical protein
VAQKPKPRKTREKKTENKLTKIYKTLLQHPKY